MRALFDVNVIIALLDPDHVFHERAHKWWAPNSRSGWASCPLTENGVVRIMSNPAYSRSARFTPSDLIFRLRAFAAETNHEFWPDDISLRDDAIFVSDRIHGSRQVTDLYLLALAAKHRGKLATFDEGIPVSAVRTAMTGNLCVV
jgi:toxin-antitoxin system PIN domain toxin